MNKRYLTGGAMAGFGFGQTTAWWLLRDECTHAPGLVALSTFGPGLLVFGLLMLVLSLARSNEERKG